MAEAEVFQTGRRQGVVIACRDEAGRYLLVRRSLQVSRAPGRVGFPGGEIEAGESQQEAVVREAREELALEVLPLACLWHKDLPDRPWTLWGWTARIVGGQMKPNPSEVAEVFWWTAQEAAACPEGLETNREFLAVLEAEVRRKVTL